MIVAGRLMLDAPPDGVRLVEGYVRIEGERIAEVAEGAPPGAADLGGPHALVAPGFLDAHLHLPQFDTIGAHGLPLLEWLDGVTFPAERRWEDPAYARGMAARVARQLLSVGTTGVAAYATIHAEATHAALDTLRGAGLRGVVGQTLLDREAPGWLTRPHGQLLEETAALLDAFPPTGRLAAAVTPRFAITCTPELLRGAGDLARERGATIQTHLAETLPECDRVAELFGGNRYVDVYRDAGLVTDRAVFGHGIYLDAADRAALAEAGAVVAHCPTANSFLRSGAMDRAALLDSGVRLALGSDIGGGYERSMPRVARAMIETASARGDRYPSAAQAWRQLTAGNADALGWPDAGRLAPGAPADLVLVEPDVPWLAGPVDPLAVLLFAWDDRWVKRTWALGRVAYAAS